MKKNIINYLLIIMVGFLIYIPTLSFNFTYLDDNEIILQSYDFIGKWSNIPQFFKEDVFHTPSGGSYYRPLMTLSLAIDARLGGLSPFPYHLSNVLLHLIAACLLFLFLQKLKYKKGLALFFSLVFTVHPVLTQTVAWVPGRNDSLLAIFVLAAFISFLNFLETKKWLSYLFHLLFLVLALFTKENAIFIPLLCLLYLLLVYKEKLFSRNKLYFIIGWLITILPWFFIRKAALHTALANTNYNIGQSLLLNSPAIISYIGKILLPFNLGILPILKDMTMVYGIIVMALMVILLFFSKNRRLNFIIFGILWFLLFLFPSFIRSISIVPDFSEHRIYVPIIGLFLILLEIDFTNFLKNKKFHLLTGTFVIIILSSVSIFYSRNFKNRLSFWEKAVKTSPSSAFNHNNLGSMYYLDGIMDKAETEWKKAAEFNPREHLVHGNLGLIYMNTDRLQEAETEYLKEIEINPYYDNVYFNLGILRYKQARIKEAETLWRKTLEINPNYIDAYNNLAILFYEQKNLKDAIYCVEQMQKRGATVHPELLKALNIR